jgi:hypothetical protein
MSLLILAIIVIIILIVVCIYRPTEKMGEPILRIHFQPITDFPGKEYQRYTLTVYDDKSISKSIFNPDNGTTLEVNYAPSESKWFAAARIINFPYTKTHMCPNNPTAYTLEFAGRKFPIGCAPMHIYNDIAVINS